MAFALIAFGYIIWWVANNLVNFLTLAKDLLNRQNHRGNKYSLFWKEEPLNIADITADVMVVFTGPCPTWCLRKGTWH